MEAMSGSRRFLLLLLVACVSCVFLVQQSLDGWNLRNSLPSYSLHTEPKTLQVLDTKEQIINGSLEKEHASTAVKIIYPITSTTKSLKEESPININTSWHSSGTGQVRRLPLGKVPSPSKTANEQILINRQERLQEILKHGTIVRGKSVDPMKSLLAIPLVNPDSVKRIIILTYFRSGSSFFGDLLQQNWKTFYHFEPLHSMTYNSRIGDDKIDKAFNLFDGILNCNYTKLPDFMQWVKQPHNQFLFSNNMFLRVTCRNNPKICFNATFVNAVCQRSPVHVMKLTRLHMRHLKEYLEKNSDMNIKVVYLTRDPRGIVSSRWSLFWCNGTECSDPNVLCHEMYEDLKFFNDMQKENPSNFIKVRYEDVSLNPEAESRKLFEFLQLPFTAPVKRFLKTHTVGRRTDDNNPYSTRRNTTAMAFTWRERFTFDQVIKVQNSCDEVITNLNHSFISTPNQLPFPNGKPKPVTTPAPSKKFNKNPLYLKSQIINKNLSPDVSDFKFQVKNSEIKFLNNTSIEIHKTFNISDDSLKNSSRTIDYILVKESTKR